ncbi:MAG: dihydroorotase [Candidatus Magnetoglobus multicellularis str. Araruama]|uniref:Dihydroorotase n=1 Tax=Candidatus Magnetoglobus multicellularis str. Araruama TaxID=890399 RepID=A0A1V1P815_9BACT|nr:MAG: dihydroorotase [Candidatus Magnetoglobus multicellularis str. Araruama]
MRILIENGTVVDPGQSLEAIRSVYIDGNIIAGVLEPDELTNVPFPKSEADLVYDAQGKMICPGLIDMHVHFRDPGQEYKETIETGCKAAAQGGFTDVCCMPNTTPVNDQPEITRYMIEKARSLGGTRVHPVAAISPGSAGKALTEMGLLLDAGACAFSDDGHPVSDSQLMRRAMEYARSFDALLISHCEDLRLADGVMNESIVSTRLGLAGIPNAAESIMVMRDIALCELTGARLHFAHISTAQSVEALKIAKDKGLPVTAETAPHYFTLTDSAVLEYDTYAKMNPPLRSETDREAIRQGLADGTIDVIATDHAPHIDLEKNVPFDQAANGIIGLETSLALGLKLVHDNILTFSQLIEKNVNQTG